jgi:3',5'-cyclic AMP phosphodiesterase CpdA
MARIAHISDLHIEGTRAENVLIEEGLVRVFRKMRLGDLLIVSGDLTNNGEAGEYSEATRLLTPFKGQILATMGNHDQGWLGLFSFSAARKRWAKFVLDLAIPDTIQVGRWLVAGFDSVRHTSSLWDTAQGNLGAGELQRMEEHLAKAQQWNLLAAGVMHHSVFDHDQFELLRDKAKVERIILGRYAAMFMGHEHCFRRKVVQGTILQAATDFKTNRESVWSEAV